MQANSVYRWGRDPAFEEKFQHALAESTQELEAACFRRARLKSDLLLIFMLKARRPEVNSDRVTRQGLGPAAPSTEINIGQFTQIATDRLTDNELAAMRRLT